MFMVTLYANGAVSAHEKVQLNAESEPTKCKLIEWKGWWKLQLYTQTM